MSELQFKVTDKRMFTPEGELKEEFRSVVEEKVTLEAPGGSGEADPEALQEPRPEEPTEASSRTSSPDSTSPGSTSAGPPLELPQAGPGLAFMDLVAMLAEPVPIFLGDASMGEGPPQEDLEMARLHIELLDVLRRKTIGNLTAQESQVLEDILYQLRMRYVQKQG